MENKNPFLDKLKQRLRFVLFDDQSYQELKSMTLTRFQILTRILSVLLLFFSLTAALIALSPLREYIPGYSPPHLSEELVRLSLKTDQLLEEIQLKDQKLRIKLGRYGAKKVEDNFSWRSIAKNRLEFFLASK